MNIPDELTYVPAPTPTPVVVKRQAFELRNPKSDVNIPNNLVFDFRINQRTFVDLKSFYLKMDMIINNTIRRTEFQNGQQRVNLMNLFDEIILRNEAGVVIERLDTANVIAEIYKILFSNAEYDRSFATSYSNTYNIEADQFTQSSLLGTIPVFTFHLPILKILGFFQTGKIIRPSTFGGLHLEFRMVGKPEILFQTVLAEDDATYADNMDSSVNFQNISLFYDECIVDSSYEQFYNQNFDTRGFRLDIETVDHTSQTLTSDLNADTVTRLGFEVSNARALVSVLRPSSHTQKSRTPSNRFIPPKESNYSYQYVNQGGRFPLVPVTTHAQNLQEVYKFKRSTGTLSQSTHYHRQTQSHFNPLRIATVNPQTGSYLMFAHLERLLNSRFTGIPLDSNTLVLEMKLGANMETVANTMDIYKEVATTDTFLLDSYCLYTASVYVMNGQVSVSK